MPGMLFGLNVSTQTQAGTDPVAAASKAEQLGFDFVSASDHLHGGRPTYEPWTLLSWIAAATSRIRVATRVLAVPYRPPPVLAKMAETLDRLSGGRLILGLGGGAVDEEFRAFGLGVRSPRDKVDGLAEAIHILRGVWSQPTFTLEGRLYRTDGAELEPKPDHPIPIWLGTYGRRALALTGQLPRDGSPRSAMRHPSRSPPSASGSWRPPAPPAGTPTPSPGSTTSASASTSTPTPSRRW
jgi:alkanesulfonate monooxygenase SsuD/methylene tetrahydromethanopterin reductase-like flavin-dependent oxidoreductase (luciferase family)